MVLELILQELLKAMGSILLYLDLINYIQFIFKIWLIQIIFLKINFLKISVFEQNNIIRLIKQKWVLRHK